MGRCCTDLIKFILFFLNFVCFLIFAACLAGTIYTLLNAKNTIIGQEIEHSLSTDNPTATYFSFIIIFLVVFSFLCLFTCLGCCGSAFKSGCMLGSFIVILFVLFGGAVGAVIFLHTQYGKDGVMLVLEQELSRTAHNYKEDNILTFSFWNWLQETFDCCGVAEVDGYKIWTTSDILPVNEKVPESCCKPGEQDCMYEPNRDTAFLNGCVPKLLLYVQIVFYGIPVVMFTSLVMAFVVSSQVSRADIRRKQTRQTGPYGGYDEGPYSGCDDDFHQYSANQNENAPYNPHYEQELRSRMENAGFAIPNFNQGGRAPQQAHTPLLHEAPPTYHEAVVMRK